MRRPIRWLLIAATLVAPARGDDGPVKTPTGADRSWVELMRRVHARFTGCRGTFAQFGDSITVSLAYWAPLRHERKHPSPEAERAYALVDEYMQPDCWDRWKGPEYGSDGSKTIRWAEAHVGAWLEKLNPEVALIMFGTNDLGEVPLEEYEARTRAVVRRCLDNGTVVILSTIPPRSGQLDRCRVFAEAVRRVGRDLHVPVVDYFATVLERRPDDWDGSQERFREVEEDEYQVPTLISGDGVHPSNPRAFAGDYSEAGLRTNGYVLRNYLTLLAYADVIRDVLKPED
jgi:lysophospholipase L1-like esterase